MNEKEKDDKRFEWLTSFIFERKWDGTIGRPSDWYIAGNYRHITKRMKGETLRGAIDTAMRDDEAPRGGE